MTQAVLVTHCGARQVEKDALAPVSKSNPQRFMALTMTLQGFMGAYASEIHTELAS